MKINKGDHVLDFKTGNSQMSDVDLFSKLEASFLEKFFKYNISDYFSELFINAYEDVFNCKASKSEKGLLSSLFIANKDFQVVELEGTIDKFYRLKSKSFEEKQLPHAFKLLFCNSKDQHVCIKEQ